MSKLKINKIQIGQDTVTATNNFVIKQSDTPDGKLRIQNGNDMAGTDLVVVDSNGDLTISHGTMSQPSFGLGYPTINFKGNNAASPGRGGAIGFESYDNASGSAAIAGAGGNLIFYTGATSYASAAEKMRLNNAGNLYLGSGASQSYTAGSSTGYALFGNSEATTYITTYGSGHATKPSALEFVTLNSTRMLIDANGYLGIGVTPSAWNQGRALELSGVGQGLWGNSTGDIWMVNNCYYNSGWKFAAGSGTAKATYYRQGAGLTVGTHTWGVAGSGTAGGSFTFTDVMTLDASGNLLVGATTNGTGARARIQRSVGSCELRVGSDDTDATLTLANDGQNSAAITRVRSNQQLQVVNVSAGVYVANGGNSWQAISDENKKDIIEPIIEGLAKTNMLRAIIGKYKTDADGTRRSFLIAQDVQKVLPEAVDTSDPNQLGLSYTDVIPLLVAAIQELSAKNDLLESLLTTMESRLAALEMNNVPNPGIL